MSTILVVDDELGIRGLLSEILSDEGHTVELAESAAQARQVRERTRVDLVLLDIWMPDVDGISLLKEWGSAGQLTMPVIMMSGHGTIDTAVEATKFGATAFLEKPITLQKLLRAVEQALAVPAPRVEPPAPPPPASLAPARPGGAFAPPPAYARDVPPGLRPTDGLAGTPGVADRHGDGPVALPSAVVGHATPVHGPSAGFGALAAPSHGVAMPAALQSFELDRPLREARDAFEKAYFEFHLAMEHGSMTRVAEKTGLERTHLYRKLKQLGVDLTRHKRGAAFGA